MTTRGIPFFSFMLLVALAPTASAQEAPAMSLTDALAYARWLGRDLPTEIEWEYAGKAGRSGDEVDTAPRDASGRPTANWGGFNRSPRAGGGGANGGRQGPRR